MEQREGQPLQPEQRAKKTKLTFLLHLTVLFCRLNVTRFDIVQLSWKVFASSSLELELQTKLTINFSG